VAKDDPTTPGAEGADEQAKIEQEAAESKAAEAETEAAAEPAPEEEPKPKPKPRRRRAKKDEPAAEAADESGDDAAEEAKHEGADAETEAEAAEADGEPEPEDEKGRPQSGGRRRGGAAAAASRSRGSTPARRTPDGDVTVRARAKYVRCAPRKARLVIDHIRGKKIDEARAILLHTPRAASRDVLKLLESAVANAENNHELVADELRVGKAYVDEGPTLKRYRPRALGRATRIRKRTSHLTIELVVKE
jgi:ribosomal protein L22